MPTDIDEELLKQIAQVTEGKYFRATDNNKLTQIYDQIDKLEKTKIEVKQFSTKKDEFLIFAIFAAIFLLSEVILRNSILRNIP